MKYIILFFMEAFVFIPCAIFWIRTIDRHIRKNETDKGLCDVTITREGWRDDE